MIELQIPDGPKEVERVKNEVQQVLLRKTSAEWKHFFHDKDCCVEVIEAPETIGTTDPHLLHRGVNLTVSFPDGSSLLTPKTPLAMTGVNPSRKPGPGLGEQNEELLGKRQLGLKLKAKL